MAVDHLIDWQVVVPEIGPAVVGTDPIRAFLDSPCDCKTTRTVKRQLETAIVQLNRLNSAPMGVPVQLYAEAERLLPEIPSRLKATERFNVLLHKHRGDLPLTASHSIINDVMRGVSVLRSLRREQDTDPLSTFRESFRRRFGQQEVPLTTALDPETGLQGWSEQDLIKLPHPIHTVEAPESDPPVSQTFEKRDRLLLQSIFRKRHDAPSRVLDVTSLVDSEAKHLPPLPNTFAALVVVLASPTSKGGNRRQVHLRMAAGPSSGWLLARFCNGNKALTEHVRRNVLLDAAYHRDSTIAEIIHLPPGRTGNVTVRPRFHEYEIPFLGHSQVPQAYQLAVQELALRLEKDLFVLRSTRLQCDIIPRLTCAHNAGSNANHALYRFLYAMQHQNVASRLAWDWGPLACLPYLPRVVTGRTILAPARWYLDEREIAALRSANDTRSFRLVQKMRRERGMPRFIALVDGDNELLIDLENVLAVECLSDLVGKRKRALLTEVFVDSFVAKGPDGQYVNQMVIPLHKVVDDDSGKVRVRSRPGMRRESRYHNKERTIPPGSAWLYYKIYSRPSDANRLLADLTRGLVRRSMDDGSVKGWFFLRYSDPDPHVRIRFRCHTGRLAEMFERSNAVLSSRVEADIVDRFEIATYDREIERYGGTEGLTISEEVFCADSVCSVALIEEQQDNSWWNLATSLIHLVRDLRVSAHHAAKLLSDMRDQYQRNHFGGVDRPFRRSLAQVHRDSRYDIERRISDPDRALKQMSQASSVAIRHRAEEIRPLICRLRRLAAQKRLSCDYDAIVGSYIHMHVNRCTPIHQQLVEVTLYDTLARAYTSIGMRRRSQMVETSP